jgi:hypothetical protein
MISALESKAWSGRCAVIPGDDSSPALEVVVLLFGSEGLVLPLRMLTPRLYLYYKV